TFTSNISLPRVLDAAECGELYSRRSQWKALPDMRARWKRRGIGLAAAWQGFGMGAGVPDRATVRIELRPSGRYHLYAGCPEMGQGNTTAFLQLAAHELRCTVDAIEATTGDSLGPRSGSSNASRTLFVVGSAAAKAAIDLREKVIAAVRRVKGEQAQPELVGQMVYIDGQAIPLAELAVEFGPLIGEGYFHPQQPDPLMIGLPHAAYSYSVQLALVEVDLLTGEIVVLQMENYLDAGRVIHPGGAEGQAEGGMA